MNPFRPAPDAPCTDCGTRLGNASAEPLAPILCPSCGTVQPAPAWFGDYLVRDRLAAGERAVVYRAVSRAGGPAVALKTAAHSAALDPDTAAIFRAHAAVAKAVDHPNVSRLLEAGECGGVPFLVTEFAVRGTLDDVMAKGRPLHPEAAVRLALDLARGLAAVHALGFLHGDIKPGNVILAEDGTAKLLDFDLARPADGEGGTWASPWYASPERVAGAAEDARSDLYSLGATLFHAVCARPPHDADSLVDILRLHREAPPPDPAVFAPELPITLGRLIMRLLAKHPDQRPPSAAALVEELERIARLFVPDRGAPVRDLVGVALLILVMLVVAVLARHIRNRPDTHPPDERPPAEAPPAPPERTW